MRTVDITVHNNLKLQIFIEKRNEGFELWIVGPITGRRLVLDHHLTRDNLEEHLAYAKSGDLTWRDAVQSDLPSMRHQNAIEMEETIKKAIFWDYENWPEVAFRSVARHFGSVSFLQPDPKATKVAKGAILGEWTDDVILFRIERDNKLRWACSDVNDPLNTGERIHGHTPDWWNFSMWKLHLMNLKHKCGTYVDVLRVDERELHLQGTDRHRLARVFRKV